MEQYYVAQYKVMEWVQFSSFQSFSHVWFFVNPCIAARQASLSIINSWSLLKLMFIESVMPSKHLIHCYPHLLPPSIISSIKVFQWVSSLHQLAKVLEYYSVSLWSASFCTPRSNLHVTPGISWHSNFGFQSPVMKRLSIRVLVLEGLVGLHRTVQLQLLQHY